MSYTRDKSVYASYGVSSGSITDWAGSPQFRTWGKSILALRYITGELNPKWRDQVRAMSNATTVMSGEYNVIRSVPGSFALFSRTPGATCDLSEPIKEIEMHGHTCAYQYGLPDWPTQLDSTVANRRATIAFLRNIRKANQSFDGLTFLGELRESLRMIRRPAEGLRDLASSFLGDVRKHKQRRPHSWKRNLGRIWLEYAFGWTPLISDVKNIVKAYRDLAARTDMVRVSGFGIEEVRVADKCVTEDTTLFSWTPPVHSNCIATERVFEKRYGALARTTEAGLWANYKLFGFKAEEFIPTAWELLPWSFLVDYFTNIGDLVEASVTSTAGLRWSSLCVVRTQSRRVSHSTDLKLCGSFSNCAVSVSCSPSSALFERRFVNRGPSNNFNHWKDIMGGFSFELPGRSGQWANIVALVSVASGIHPQRFKG